MLLPLPPLLLLLLLRPPLQAHDNLNRVFVAFGAYVAATCGAMHIAKKAVKWVAWRLPFGGKKVAGPAVAFTADVLLPTSFFGPWLATYVIVKIVVQVRNTRSFCTCSPVTLFLRPFGLHWSSACFC